ncbi:actin cytoskeleton organization protein [Crucibulum laeve]|uniref:Actin cytoskeleton organization protein n=1 Tax=Crucibulum laeve TaxID=68775 RepID=A0A5C3MDN3_9AGAR|nr:actin cytoskeleton organization protein [Crucibulum laeve]
MSSAALERQIRPIYDALDTGSNKSAIVDCNKLLKKHPKNELIKSLKALALVRSQKVEESLVLCDEILAAKPTNDAVLTAMMHVLRGLGRHKDTVTMFEEAYKQQPSNEELGAQTFFANVRAGQWKSAQQVATRMYKQFQEDRYLYWSIMGTVLQAEEASTPPAMRTLLYKLAHRLITSSPTPSYLSADRFYLHLSILRELELFDEAHKLIESEVGGNICSTSLSCNELRREIWRLRGLTKEEGDRAKKLIVEKKDRNWLEFLSVLDTTFISKGESAEHVKETQELFTQIAEQDGQKDRSGLLGLLELERRARENGVSFDSSRLVTLMEQYFDKIGDKACCFEDLKPYLTLEGEELTNWTAFLDAIPSSFTTLNELRRLINSYKMVRYNIPQSDLTIEAETSRIQLYTKKYFEALPIGADLPVTELQPADDLALLAGSAYITVWKLTNEERYLFEAVSLLEYVLTKSKQSFLTRLLLIRIYRLLGAPALALEHYRAMHVKQVQHDTLSHFILSRVSMFSLAPIGDITFATECLETTQIYLSNSQETSDFIVRAFTSEKYSQIPEFIEFEQRLENSLQRDIVKMEHVRMRLGHEPISSDIIDMELIELKFLYDRTHHDNRDFNILVNYQPRISEGLNEQTLLFGKGEGLSWLRAFLRLYIRAFQQGSDLDDMVEEKLLIGDRPKHVVEQPPLKERLRKNASDNAAESAQQLTSDELAFVSFADELANWLEPYHDYARPPPAVVLAEAAKQTVLKTGHPLKGVEIPPQNGTNGSHKKDDEPPVVIEPTEAIVKFFDNAKARYNEVKDNASPIDVLHVAALAQEAFLLFNVETLRFKTASVVKANKLGGLVSSFKAIRINAISVLKEISADLVRRSESEGTSESRKTFVDACTKLITSELDHDFVLNIAKRVSDSRKKVLEGIGKGMGKICSSYSH